MCLYIYLFVFYVLVFIYIYTFLSVYVYICLYIYTYRATFYLINAIIFISVWMYEFHVFRFYKIIINFPVEEILFSLLFHISVWLLIFVLLKIYLFYFLSNNLSCFQDNRLIKNKLFTLSKYRVYINNKLNNIRNHYLNPPGQKGTRRNINKQWE